MDPVVIVVPPARKMRRESIAYFPSVLELAERTISDREARSALCLNPSGEGSPSLASPSEMRSIRLMRPGFLPASSRARSRPPLMLVPPPGEI